MTGPRHFWGASGLRACGMPSLTSGTRELCECPLHGMCRGCPESR
jgi:hypothetical protein